MKCCNCGNELTDNTMFCDNCGQKVKVHIEENSKCYCGNCGSEIERETEFCGNCGTRRTPISKTEREVTFCANCGSEIDNNLEFCGNCGQQIHQDNDAQIGIETSEEKSNKKSSLKAIIFILILIILLLVAVIVGYICVNSSNNKDEFQPSDVNVETQAPHEESIESEKIDDSISEKNEEETNLTRTQGTSTQNPNGTVIDSKGYATYKCSIYNFCCKYPSWFKVLSNTNTSFECMSADGLGRMEIACTEDYEYTVDENMNNYVLSVGGTIDYKKSGNDYFAVRVKLDSKYYYRYAHFKNGKMYRFSFIFPDTQFEAYDDMINEIYADFIKQF